MPRCDIALAAKRQPLDIARHVIKRIDHRRQALPLKAYARRDAHFMSGVQWRLPSLRCAGFISQRAQPANGWL